MAISHLIVALSACATGVYTHAVEQREPMITPGPIVARQGSTDTRLIGYYSESGDLSWQTGRCVVGMTWTTSNSYGKCCSTSRGCGQNDFATRCSGDYAMYPDGPYSCSNTCNTDYIYQSTNVASPTLWIGCNYIGPQTNFYRALPATVTSATNPAASSASNSGAKTTAPTVTVPAPKSTSTPTVSRVKRNLAWIAGVVVGIIALLVICAIIIFIIISKKRKRARTLAAGGSGGAGAPPAQQQYMPPGQQQYMPPGQQQYMPPGQPGMGAMPPMQQQQYMPPQGQAYPNPASADYKGDGGPPPQWAPSPHQPPSADSPPIGGISPMSPHSSIAPNDSASHHAFHDQRLGDSRSPVPTLGEMGTSNAHQRPVSEMTVPHTPPTIHQPPVSELSSPSAHRPTPISYQAGPIQQNYHPTVSEIG
ncbi:uncharacterized protein BP5553_04533 [Venustampulla echinocandica]|uniref:Uncharacterized protein n=1 Tax=Venustampulla echinocandica TaxID=2656787 RepID=A0A370TNK7_9HELO|nr:uncharacterized protein BP5553_04533 [Venustampulla echinocandica]RDL37100.1 hypothetical protein BP5553_04533 [Venustampulla echinocandica]